MKPRIIWDGEGYFDSRKMWNICGNFGEVHGSGKKNDNKYRIETDDYIVEGVITEDDTGVFCRKDIFKNISDKVFNINTILSNMMFDGGDYQVYTQTNFGLTESSGMWQPFNTGVCAMVDSVRTTSNANPFVAIWNEQTNRGIAIHLLPESAWKIEVNQRCIEGFKTYIEVSLGIYDKNVNILLNPGESIELPEILYYSFKNKIDMDCYKLHRYINKRFPRREMPVMYNSWLCNFDEISYELIMEQAQLAAELGFECFTIDAGWFGDKDSGWGAASGDWYEQKNGKLDGRLHEIADKVRALGMRFGLWFEPDRAYIKSASVSAHSEYYIKGDNNQFFINFADDKASDFVYASISKMICDYGIDCLKFDANEDLRFDAHENAFIDYLKGYDKFIKRLRKEFPTLYIDGCASGGMRMNLAELKRSDSFWVTDNQSPFDGMKLFKNTILRMPPQAIDKWTAISSVTKGVPIFLDAPEPIIACNNSTWDSFVAIDPSFLKGFIMGSPIGFSCNLANFSEKLKLMVKGFIEDFKKERDFWKKVECRILTDTSSALVLQYNDKEMKNVKVLAFSWRGAQDRITVYPILDENKKYLFMNSEKIGSEISEDGFYIEFDKYYNKQNYMKMVELVTK